MIWVETSWHSVRMGEQEVRVSGGLNIIEEVLLSEKLIECSKLGGYGDNTQKERNVICGGTGNEQLNINYYVIGGKADHGQLILTIYVIGGGAGHKYLTLTLYVIRGTADHGQFTLTWYVIGGGAGLVQLTLTLFVISGGVVMDNIL